MALQLILQLEGVAGLAIELNGSIAGNSQHPMIGRKRVVGDWGVKQMMDFVASHDELRMR